MPSFFLFNLTERLGCKIHSFPKSNALMKNALARTKRTKTALFDKIYVTYLFYVSSKKGKMRNALCAMDFSGFEVCNKILRYVTWVNEGKKQG